MMELTVPAALEELEHVQEFVEQALEAQGISMKIQMQISIAVPDELKNLIAEKQQQPFKGSACNVVIACILDSFDEPYAHKKHSYHVENNDDQIQVGKFMHKSDLLSLGSRPGRGR